MSEINQTQDLVQAIVKAMKPEAMTLTLALNLIGLAEKKATQMGVPMVIAVVDGGGNLVAQHRMDGALFGSIAISLSKAYTAAALKTPTDQLAKTVLPGQPLYGLAETGGLRFCVFGGGIPLVSDGVCIGGLGVSGGSADQDTEVARYAARG